MANIKHVMSSVGFMTLKMQEDTNRSIGSVLQLLDGKQDFSATDLAELIQERLLPRFDRLSCITNADKKTFEKDPKFDLNNQIHAITLPEDSIEALEATLARIISRDLDRDKPLWEVYWFLYKNQTGLFWRFHHCVGDGQSIAMLLFTLSDEGQQLRSDSQMFGKRTLSDHIRLYMWLILGSILVVLRWLYLEFFFPRVPPLFSHDKVKPRKKVAFDYQKLTLERAKTIAKRFGQEVTFNDIMLSCMSGAIAKMMKEQKQPLCELPIAMPVNMRTVPIPEDLGNKIGSYSLYLPLHIEDPAERLEVISRRTRVVKFLPEQYVTYGITLACYKVVPVNITQKIFTALASHLAVVLTNVRGSEEQFSYKKHKIVALVGFVPPPNGVRMGFGIASYGGNVMISVNADEDLTENPQTLIDAFIGELDQIESVARLRTPSTPNIVTATR